MSRALGYMRETSRVREGILAGSCKFGEGGWGVERPLGAGRVPCTRSKVGVSVLRIAQSGDRYVAFAVLSACGCPGHSWPPTARAVGWPRSTPLQPARRALAPPLWGPASPRPVTPGPARPRHTLSPRGTVTHLGAREDRRKGSPGRPGWTGVCRGEGRRGKRSPPSGI